MKVVFERWLDDNDEAFYKVSMVYQSTNQICGNEQLSLENPPMKVALQFDGVETNDDGLIAEADLFELFDMAIDSYDKLLEQYAIEEEKAA